MLDDLISGTHDTLISEIQGDYLLFCKFVSKYKDVPHLLELIEKILTWNKEYEHKLKFMFKKYDFGDVNLWFDLHLIMYNVVHNNISDIKWVHYSEGNKLLADDFNADPIVIPDYGTFPEILSTIPIHQGSAKLILDAMNQWELNEKNRKEYYKELHKKNNRWPNS